ncbi:MAG: hypothetical protein H6502_03625 [Candidatus Woesearchaeota archaeon]|nr:MAG: hypothetical protein H6502_03625 [Candidatus Woesearchaeota archaeon]
MPEKDENEEAFDELDSEEVQEALVEDDEIDGAEEGVIRGYYEEKKKKKDDKPSKGDQMYEESFG